MLYKYSCFLVELSSLNCQLKYLVLISFPEYLMYLKQLPDLKERLKDSSLITLYSSDAIPPKKKPRCALIKTMCVIFVFLQGDLLHWTFGMWCP